MPEKMSAAVLKRTNRIAQISTTPIFHIHPYFRTLQLNSIQDPEWKKTVSISAEVPKTDAQYCAKSVMADGNAFLRTSPYTILDVENPLALA